MRTILVISLPLTLWLASFSFVYGVHGFLCSSRWAPVDAGWPGQAVLIAVAVLAIAMQATLFFALRSRKWASPDPTMHRAGLILAATALVASIWTLIPTAVTSHCL